VSGQYRCKRCRRPVASGHLAARGFIHCPKCNFTFRASAQAPAELALRSDLVIVPVEEEGASYYVIKDPRNNRFFRIKPLEHFLVTQFDGATSLETIRRRASEQKNVLVSGDVLSRFAQKFRELGLLVGEDDDEAGALASRTFLSDVLRIKLPLASPERFLDWLYPKVRFCFSPWFVALVCLSLLAAGTVAVTHGGELVFGLGGVVNLEGLVFVLATVSLVTLLHEVAHGLTCRHFGGRVTDMGFLLLYFLPCFYCNVSDTYLFREKRQRMWVFFAGGFFELFLWALAVLGFRLVATGTVVSRALFVVAAVSFVRSLFNFNPLIKMDGYFMFSEYLGIKNLRREALRSLGRFARRIGNLDCEPVTPALLERHIFGLRGDRFLTAFGATAAVYTVLLVGTIVAYSGGYLFRSFGPDTLGVFAIALVGLLHKPAITAAATAKEVSKEKWEKLGDERKRARFVVLWAVAALIVAFFPWELRIPSELSVLPQERETVRAPSKGRIKEIHVKEGDHVEKGDLILEYDATELELERQKKEQELIGEQERLVILEKKTATGPEEIKVKEQELEAAKVQEVMAKQDLDHARELWTSGLISKVEYDRAENLFAEAIAKRRKAEAELAIAVKQRDQSRRETTESGLGTNPEVQKARIAQLQAELKQLDDLLSRTKIYAGISGTLTTYRFQEKVGDYLEEGAVVCEIINDDRVVIEMPVPEKDMDVVAVGKTIKFKVRGYPGRSFLARVDEIAPVASMTATANGRGSTILVRAFADNAGKVLKPGMTGVAKIYCGMSFLANIWTRDIVRFVRTEFWL
jgi:putative peptide zinc metalloprotease protein